MFLSANANPRRSGEDIYLFFSTSIPYRIWAKYITRSSPENVSTIFFAIKYLSISPEIEL